MRKNAQKDAAPKGNWMATFNDLVTLLLTFFVLLLSTSKLNVAKVKEASYSFSNASGFLDGGGIIDVNVFSPFVGKLSKPDSFAKNQENGQKKFAWRINNAGRNSEKITKKTIRIHRGKSSPTKIPPCMPG